MDAPKHPPGRSEWLLIAILLSGLAVYLTGSSLLWRLDQVVYDLQLRLWERPPPDDILIVAIDEASLKTMGRWPWNRRVHAQLLDNLTQEAPRAVALDILFAEPGTQDPDEDQALMKAVQRNGRVVLPVAIEQTRLGGQLVETLPYPGLGESAATLGHIHVDLDADGIARHTYLRQGLGNAFWPSLALATLNVANPTVRQTSSELKQPPATLSQTIVRDQRIFIPYAGPPGHFPRISYSQVLTKDFVPGTFKDKIVLVGATAVGLGDTLPTPLSGANQPMPDVEIQANLIDALHNDIALKPLETPYQYVVTALLVLLPLLMFPRFTPPQALFFGLAAVVVTLLLSTGLLQVGHRIYPPMAAAIALLVGYPLWSWRRLECATRFLDGELTRLRREPQLIKSANSGAALKAEMSFVGNLLPIDGWTLRDGNDTTLSAQGIVPETPPQVGDGTRRQISDQDYWISIPRQDKSWHLGLKIRPGSGFNPAQSALLAGMIASFSEKPDQGNSSHTELVEKQTQEVGDAIDNLRSVHHLLTGLVSHMDQGVILASPGGRILLANSHASRSLGDEVSTNLVGSHIARLGEHLSMQGGSTNWNEVFSRLLIMSEKVQFEARSISGREMLVQMAPWLQANGADGTTEGLIQGIIVTLSDVSSLKISEQKRNEALSFLSHDIRSPLTSILSLIEARCKSGGEDCGVFAEQIGHYTGKALTLADGFLHLAKAENMDSSQLGEVDFATVAHNAIDETYSAAQRQGIRLSREFTRDEAWIWGDASLLERALRNLIENAIRFSPKEGQVVVHLYSDGQQVDCCVHDEGPGVPADERDNIFIPFYQTQPSRLRRTGTGLGLAFVRTVAEKHKGSVYVEDAPGGGARFCFRLPALPDPTVITVPETDGT